MPLRGAAAKLRRPRTILPGKSGGRVPGFVVRGAEFRVEGNGAHVGNVTDVSLHGCYVEMNTTFPAAARKRLLYSNRSAPGLKLRARFAPRTPSWAWAFASRKSNRYNRCNGSNCSPHWLGAVPSPTGYRLRRIV